MVVIEEGSASVIASISADAIPAKLRRHGGSARQVFAITLIGTLVLAVFASRDLASWTERFGDGRVALTVQTLAASWDDAMATLGLAAPAEVLHQAIAHLLDAQWSGRQGLPDQSSAAPAGRGTASGRAAG